MLKTKPSKMKKLFRFAKKWFLSVLSKAKNRIYQSFRFAKKWFLSVWSKAKNRIYQSFRFAKKWFLSVCSKAKNFLKRLYSYWGNARIFILVIIIFVVFYQGISFWRMESMSARHINLIYFILLYFFFLLLGYWKENIEILKRIYRNSEGFVIPLLGGTATLLTFQAVSLFRSASIPEEKTLIINAWFVFITIEIFIGFIFYSIKKANLRDDVITVIKQALIKHYAPYTDPLILVESEKYSYKKIYSKVYENKKVYSKVYENAFLAKKSLLRFIDYKKLNFIFNDNEVKNIIKEIAKNVASYVEKNNSTVESVRNIEDIEDIEDDISINYMEGYNWLYVVKEGNPDDPKNSDWLQVDIEERKPSFVIFEDLNTSEEKNKFYDVNTEHITNSEYMDAGVKLTITSPDSPLKEITVSLQEWLAKRNDLR